MTPAILTLAASLAVVSGQSFGPVDLEAVDPLSLSWNQIHWLVKDQIKEVEELKAEHDEIYNEIAGERDETSECTISYVQDATVSRNV